MNYTNYTKQLWPFQKLEQASGSMYTIFLKLVCIACGFRYTVFENNTLGVVNVQPDDTASYSCEVYIKSLGSVNATGSITVLGMALCTNEKI